MNWLHTLTMSHISQLGSILVFYVLTREQSVPNFPVPLKTKSTKNYKKIMYKVYILSHELDGKVPRHFKAFGWKLTRLVTGRLVSCANNTWVSTPAWSTVVDDKSLLDDAVIYRFYSYHTAVYVHFKSRFFTKKFLKQKNKVMSSWRYHTKNFEAFEFNSLWFIVSS